jgi:hypothetical protein
VLQVIVAGPVEVIELKREVERAGGGVEDAQTFGHDLLADAVAGNHRDRVLGHENLLGDRAGPS